MSAHRHFSYLIKGATVVLLQVLRLIYILSSNAFLVSTPAGSSIVTKKSIYIPICEKKKKKHFKIDDQ